MIQLKSNDLFSNNFDSMQDQKLTNTEITTFKLIAKY